MVWVDSVSAICKSGGTGFMVVCESDYVTGRCWIGSLVATIDVMVLQVKGVVSAGVEF